MSKTRDTTVRCIARDELLIETLETHNRDAHDFHEVSVRAVRAALGAAYEAGRKSAPPDTPTHCVCPACGCPLVIRST